MHNVLLVLLHPLELFIIIIKGIINYFEQYSKVCVSFDSRKMYDLINSSQNKINSKMYSIAHLSGVCLNEEITVY